MLMIIKNSFSTSANNQENILNCLNECLKYEDCQVVHYSQNKICRTYIVISPEDIYQNEIYFYRNISDVFASKNFTSLYFKCQMLLNNSNELDFSSKTIFNIQPFSFKSKPNLILLNLSFNLLTSLKSNVFFNLTQLTNLDLSYNKIDQLSSDLILLSLNDNNLSELDSSLVQNLKSLQFFFASNNNLSLPEDYFVNLTTLCNLQLYNNKIESIQVNTLKNLLVLQLGKNNIKYFQTNLTKLQTILLLENPLRYLNYSIIDTDNSPLTLLNINGCGLTHVERIAFQNLKQLNQLVMGANTLTNVDPNLFDDLNNLKKVHITNMALVNQLKAIYPNITFYL
ncbi:unnamed protein product [Brachionus calyciflorus]|uniref:Uncharacterized protein n=1 Tax=Brachionus calyciflorus TaxID=104777 RepID=A0A814BDG8_9BILA|nr:unnamed protein product [Brachionus calyciflorus]